MVCCEVATSPSLERRMQSFATLMHAKNYRVFTERRWVRMVGFPVLKEMEVVHPAAKLIVEAAQKQEQEVPILHSLFSLSRWVTEQTLW